MAILPSVFRLPHYYSTYRTTFEGKNMMLRSSLARARQSTRGRQVAGVSAAESIADESNSCRSPCAFPQNTPQELQFLPFHSTRSFSSTAIPFTSTAQNHSDLRSQRMSLSMLHSVPTRNKMMCHQHQQIRTKVFVSEHNNLNVTSNQILDYCSNRGISIHNARVTSSHVVLQECPFCEKPTRGKADNFFKCYIKIGGGAFFCHRCGNGGSWFDFKSHLRGYEHDLSSVSVWNPDKSRSRAYHTSSAHAGAATGPRSSLPLPKQRLQAFYISNLLDSNSVESTNMKGAKSNVPDALDYLRNTRGLTAATLRKYGVGKGNYSFPNEKQNGQVSLR